MRYVYARKSNQLQASGRAAFAPESGPQGRNVADVQLSGVRQKGEVHQVRGRDQFTSSEGFLAAWRAMRQHDEQCSAQKL